MGLDERSSESKRVERREDQKCFICDGDIFSNTTRRLGNKYVCIPCIGSVSRLKDAFEEDLADRARNHFEHYSLRPSDFVSKVWANDFGIQLD